MNHQDSDPLLSVIDLRTYFHLYEGMVRAVDGVSFDLRQGQTLGIIGESGCGKSVTVQSIMRLVPTPPGRIEGGQILLRLPDAEGRQTEVVDIAALKPDSAELQRIRWRHIAMIFQEPMTAFSPVHTVGNQIIEAMLFHNPGLSKQQARREAVELLIADEPTTALDVTVEAQILALIKDLQRQYNMAMLYISHDLAVVGQVADDIMVMYLGMAVELASVREVFRNPLHPYTQALWRSIPSVDGPLTRLVPIVGTLPNPYAPRTGCPFYSRCEKRMDRCQTAVPEYFEAAPGHKVRCFLYERS